MTLTETIAGQCAAYAQDQAMALILAAPRIRAAEHIEYVLHNAGIEASATAHVSHTHITISIMATGPEAPIAEALTLAGIAFDRHPARPQDYADAFFDCGVGSYNVTVIVSTPFWLRKSREAA